MRTPNPRECIPQDVIENQAEAIDGLMRLAQHRSVRDNPRLRAAVDAIWESVARANAIACVLWFPKDTLADVADFLPPAA